ncbi:MAG: metallophosphoesterase family protein [Fimbriimonas sp.]
MGRSIFAVGDIHGHYWRLVKLIAQLPLREEDVLLFVGDYIDRGPDSGKVLQFLVELKASRPTTVFLRGNHEEMMLNARDTFQERRPDYERYALWMGNGGAETIDSYPAAKPWWNRVPDEHWAFLEATGLEYWLGPYAFVHAGFLPPDARWPFAEDPRLWVREEFLDSSHDFGARVVFGHTPQKSGRPLVQANKIGIDTAAAYGGPLTAVQLSVDDDDEMAVFQV